LPKNTKNLIETFAKSFVTIIKKPKQGKNKQHFLGRKRGRSFSPHSKKRRARELRMGIIRS